jgi:Protein of unknown function (DUF3768)
MSAASSARIRELNDAFRRSFSGGRVLVTRGVAELDVNDQLEIFARVRTFLDFTDSNDPHGEHDLGAFEHSGTRYFFNRLL